jgi:sugar phosphate isomerase/epimerase
MTDDASYDQWRLLPWTGPEGQPVFLAPGSEGGALARLADSMEAAQLRDAAIVLDHSQSVLSNPDASETETRFVAERLSECLFNALRVAECRGARLPAPEIN